MQANTKGIAKYCNECGCYVTGWYMGRGYDQAGGFHDTRCKCGRILWHDGFFYVRYEDNP